MAPQPERVLLIHTRYRERGGEEVVVEAEAALLARHGHEVIRVEFDNAALSDEVRGIGQARVAVQTIWSAAAARRVGEAIERARPDLVHVHNTFPAASPSVVAAAARRVPVVQTLHNYRLLCAAGTLFRDGHPCTDCVGRAVPWPAVAHACYRSSHRMSAVIAGMLIAHRLRGTWNRQVDAFIALTEFARQMMVEGGLPSDRVYVKSNFLEPDPGIAGSHRGGFFFAGRLSEEKGVDWLLEAANVAPGSITVAGTGPLADAVRRAGESGLISYVGLLARQQVLMAMGHAQVLVFPSRWFEAFPMTVVEAFACGLPVIAPRLGSMAEIIEDGRTGVLYPPTGPAALAEAIGWALGHPRDLARMGEAARTTYLARYRGEANYQTLLGIYERALARAASRRGMSRVWP